MDPYIGQIQLFAFNYAPRGWELCAGQMMSAMDNQALFALLGTRYGGDGRTNFALPNLQGAEPVPQMRYYIALDGLFPPRS